MSHKIKIMHVRDSSGIFGAERVILTIGKNIDRSRFNMTLLCMKRSDARSDKLIKKAKELDLDVKTVDVNGRFDIRAVRQIEETLIKNRINVLHSHDFKSDFYSLLASANCRLRRVCTAHGSTRDSWLKRFYLYCDEKLFYRRFDRIIAVSEDLKVHLLYKGVSADKIRVIRNGLDSDLLRTEIANERPLKIPAGRIVFGVIGRLYPDKGHRFFLQALKDVLRIHPEAFAVIVGDGPARNDIEQQVRRLNMEKYVELCGVRSDMQAVYDRIDCLVIPSLTEGLPYVLLEAMANKVPVIATSVGDVPKLIEDRETGRLIPSGDRQALAMSMSEFLEDPAATAVMTEKAGKVVNECFSAERMVRETEQLYLELMK